MAESHALLQEKHCENLIMFAQGLNRDFLAGTSISHAINMGSNNETKLPIVISFHIIKFSMSNPGMDDVNVPPISCGLKCT